MVHRRVRRSSRPLPLDNHNRAWIWGRHVVGETLAAGRWPILELALGDSLDHESRRTFERLAKASGISTQTLDDDGLTRLCRAADHQGCAARMAEFPYVPPDEFLATLDQQAVILILDRIQDPFNFGAMIRTVDGLGLAGVVIGSRAQAGVNSQVARSSAGAVNHVPICRVDDLPTLMTELVRRDWQIWGASERGAAAVTTAEFRPPLALVIGNEGTGVSAEVLALCTATVQIPMAGRVSSLNAAVSAGILCYEAVRSRPKN